MTPNWRNVGELAIEVNLDGPPPMPHGAEDIAWNWAVLTGQVRVERIGDILLVGGREVWLHREPEQNTGQPISGAALRERLQNQLVLDPRIAQALEDNPGLVPPSLFAYAEELLFWGAGFVGDGGEEVRYLMKAAPGTYVVASKMLATGRFGHGSPALVLQW